MVTFKSKHQLCNDYCFEANSKAEITRDSFNISTGYLIIWHYFNKNSKEKKGRQ